MIQLKYLFHIPQFQIVFGCQYVQITNYQCHFQLLGVYSGTQYSGWPDGLTLLLTWVASTVLIFLVFIPEPSIPAGQMALPHLILHFLLNDPMKIFIPYSTIPDSFWLSDGLRWTYLAFDVVPNLINQNNLSNFYCFSCIPKPNIPDIVILPKWH